MMGLLYSSVYNRFGEARHESDNHTNADCKKIKNVIVTSVKSSNKNKRVMHGQKSIGFSSSYSVRGKYRSSSLFT